jgi:hypothetical protein
MTATTSRFELGATSPPTLAAALDCGRFDAIAEFAEMAASYWHAVALAADRAERLTIEVHCRQVAAVTRETFSLVKMLGSREAEE